MSRIIKFIETHNIAEIIEDTCFIVLGIGCLACGFVLALAHSQL